MNYLKLVLYACAAIGNSLLGQTTQPTSDWEWYRYGLTAVVAGLLAVKAYQSDTDKPK